MRDGCGAPCGVTCVPYSTVDVRSDVRCDAATHTAYVCVSPYAMFDILKNVCANEPYTLPFRDAIRVYALQCPDMIDFWDDQTPRAAPADGDVYVCQGYRASWSVPSTCGR